MKISTRESSKKISGARRLETKNLRRRAGFFAFSLLFLAVLPGCGFFKGGSSEDSSGVTAPGAAGYGYSHHIFTSPSVCAAAHGSLAIYRKYGSWSGSASRTSPLNNTDPFASNSFYNQGAGGQFSGQTYWGAGNWGAGSGAGTCGSSGEDGVFIRGNIKDSRCRSGIIYFRCEGRAFTDTGFCCSSGHASCSSWVKTHKTTTATGEWAFVPITGGNVTLIPSVQSYKTKVYVNIQFGRNQWGQSNRAGFHCSP